MFTDHLGQRWERQDQRSGQRDPCSDDKYRPTHYKPTYSLQTDPLVESRYQAGLLDEPLHERGST